MIIFQNDAMLETSFPLRGKHPYPSVEKNALRKQFCEDVAVLNAAMLCIAKTAEEFRMLAIKLFIRQMAQ